MRFEIKVPSVGESIVEATVGEILKPNGSMVGADEEILELETDKVNQALVAPQGGVLQLNVKSGDVVKVGQVIGTIETDGKGTSQPPPPAQESLPPPPPSKSSSPEKPLRKMADEALQEMNEVPKTPTPVPPQPQPPPKEEKGHRQKMSKLRKVIAERLVRVKNETAMLTTFNEIDMSQVIAIREKEQKQFSEKHQVKLGFMSFFIRATVAALQEFPLINGRIDGDEIVYHSTYDIACAVSTDKGLMVPVIRGADQLSSAEIEKKLKELADKARNQTIAIDDLQGGTFTITNAGIFGSLFSTPILNPPQSAILGMHNIVKRPVAIDDQVVIRPMMYVALSYDHRLIDGKEAVLFLMHMKKNLEEPARLLLDL